MPCFVGVMFLSTPIMKLLYPKEPSSIGEILFAMSFTIVLIALLQTFTAILQAVGKPMLPVVNLFIASVLKLIFTYVLTAIPAINVKGAAIGTIAAYVIAMVLDYLCIKKMLKVNFRLKNSVVKPALMSAVMGLVIFISYNLSFMLIKNMKIACLIAMLFGGATYLFELFFMGGLSKTELLSIPLGKKIAKKIYKN